MLRRLVLAIVVGIVVTLVCYLVGAILVTININWVITVGNFLKTYGGLLGLLAAIWFYFTGGKVAV